MKKPTPIIEYQNGIQRTPQETMNYIQDEIDKGNVDYLLILYRNKKFIGHVSGSSNRDYTKSDILWDIVQWLREFIS